MIEPVADPVLSLGPLPYTVMVCVPVDGTNALAPMTLSEVRFSWLPGLIVMLPVVKANCGLGELCTAAVTI